MIYRRKIETEFRSCHSLTADVNELIKESGVKEGICLLQLEDHTTSLGITSFWDPRGLEDMMDEIDRNFPARVYLKNQESTFDACGRVKSAVIGSSATLLIKDGKLILGSSQGLVLIEHDGPRVRSYTVLIKPMEVIMSKHNLKSEFMGMHDLTGEIREAVKNSKVKDGICHVSMLHSTAGLVVCDNDDIALKDVMSDIEKMVPTRGDFKHRETASDAGGHVKTAFTDSQISLIIKNGDLLLGKNQGVIFAEFDGPRPRSYYVGIIAA